MCFFYMCVNIYIYVLHHISVTCHKLHIIFIALTATLSMLLSYICVHICVVSNKSFAHPVISYMFIFKGD
jgi:hypothetical protein